MVNQRWFVIPPSRDEYKTWRIVDENNKAIGFFYEKEDAIEVVDNHNLIYCKETQEQTHD